MSKLKLGELFAGYGGLGMAVEEVFDAELAWYAEFDDAPSKIMAHHWPGVPNHRDVTAVDWSQVEPVDIISGGSPCQDLSAAGRRAGMTEGTRSNLWVSMREAIATIKPTYVVWENVRGAYSANATSEVEFCPGCMGSHGGDGEPVLRALGRVLGDLHDLGFDAEWRGLRAADVGAPHGRFRVFILATRRGAEPSNTDHAGLEGQRDSSGTAPSERRGHVGESANASDSTSENSDCPTCGQRWESAPGQAEGGRARPDTSGRSGAPVAHAEATAEPPGIGGREGRAEHAREQARPDAIERGPSTDWGVYAPAIRRWEALRGTAPAPTELTTKGKHRLNAEFASWMMGLEPGHVTKVPGITRNEQLKAIGNGVVPQQAVAALKNMLEASK